MSNLIQNLIIDHDIQGLICCLRNQNDPEQRIQAAQALGSLNDYDAIESLAYSFLLDDNEKVRAASLDALENITGKTQVQDILNQYRQAHPLVEEWLVSPPPKEALNSDNIGEFLRIVLSDTYQPELRIKAIQALKDLTDIRIVPTLAHIARWEDDPRVKNAAQSMLEYTFGDMANEIIENCSVSYDEQTFWLDDRESEDLSEDEPDIEIENPGKSSQANPYQDNLPVIQDVSPSTRSFFLAFFVVFAVFVILFFIYSK